MFARIATLVSVVVTALLVNAPALAAGDELPKQIGLSPRFQTPETAVDSGASQLPVDGIEPATTVADLLLNAVEPMTGVLAGGQPTAEMLVLAGDEGYKTVINLRDEGEPGTGEQEVEEAGLRYVSLPIAGAEGLTAENAHAFARVLAEAELPAIVHCGSGNRVGALFALKAYFVDGVGAAEALELGRASGLTSLDSAVQVVLGLSEAN